MGNIQKLLDSVRDGDITAFEALYETMKKPLYTIILRITHDTAMSEDILQDMFLKIYLSTPAPTSNPRAYLCRMAHNLAIDSMRKRKQASTLDDAASLPDHSADNLSQRIDIEEALSSLSERDRRIVSLHINGELKFREIASIMEVPLGTVLWAYQKSIKQLQRILGGAL